MKRLEEEETRRVVRQVIKRRLRLILDDQTPACLPGWAQDEIVRRRMQEHELLTEIGKLRARLAQAEGRAPTLAEILGEDL